VVVPCTFFQIVLHEGNHSSHPSDGFSIQNEQQGNESVEQSLSLQWWKRFQCSRCIIIEKIPSQQDVIYVTQQHLQRYIWSCRPIDTSQCYFLVVGEPSLKFNYSTKNQFPSSFSTPIQFVLKHMSR
jgi:hypothetical protein